MPEESFAETRTAPKILSICAFIAGMATIGVAAGYHAYLALRGLRLMQLWGGGRIRGWSVPVGTEGAISLGSTMSNIGLLLGVASGVICLLAFMESCRTRTLKHGILSVAAAVLALIGFYMNLRIGFILGGL